MMQKPEVCDMSELHNKTVRLYVTYVDGLRILSAMEPTNGNKAYLIRVEPVVEVNGG